MPDETWPKTLKREDGSTTKSWGPKRGRSEHEPDCTCPRCTGFPKGHALTVRHGAYASPAKLAGDTEKWASWIRATAPLIGPADEPTIVLAARALVRHERAQRALDQVDGVTEGRELAAYLGEKGLELATLREDARRWGREASRYLTQLGCSPQSRAALGLDVVRMTEIATRSAPIDLDAMSVQARAELFAALDRALAEAGEDVVEVAE